MITKIFDVEQGKVTPSMHCYVIPELKAVIDAYPNNHIDALAYCFYMSCPYKSENPYADYPEEDRAGVLKKTYPTILPDALVIIRAIQCLRDKYETAGSKYHASVKESLFKTVEYLNNVVINDEKDGNLARIHAIQKEAGKVLESLITLERIVEEEKNSIKAKANRKFGKGEL